MKRLRNAYFNKTYLNHTKPLKVTGKLGEFRSRLKFALPRSAWTSLWAFEALYNCKYKYQVQMRSICESKFTFQTLSITHNWFFMLHETLNSFEYCFELLWAFSDSFCVASWSYGKKHLCALWVCCLEN